MLVSYTVSGENMKQQKWLYLCIGIIVTFALTMCVVMPRKTLAVASFSPSPSMLIIDAGHGGEDGGAISVSGKRECEFNLEIARRTADLAALLGIRSKMIRTSDVSIHDDTCNTIAEKKRSDLRNRVKIVNETPNAILLSIHQNHFAEEKYFGTQVFYASNSESKSLAEKMQEDVRLLNPKNYRKIKAAQSVYLLEHVSCTSVLVECGFLSNYKEEQLLGEADYQKKLAMAMLRSVATMEEVVMNHET